MRAVVSEFLDEAALRRLCRHLAVDYDPELWRDPGVLARAVAGADALVVRNQTQVDERLLAAAPHLRVVGRLGAGLDNVDVAAARRRGVAVVYAPDANADSVAEHALALLLALARRLTAADRAVRAGRWPRQELQGVEVAGKTLGILGFGRVGMRLARRARALGLRVLAWHPRRPPDDPVWASTGCQPVDERTLFARSHFLSVHLPLTPATRGFVDARRLGWMRPGAYLINTSRGEVVDEPALLAALRSGRLAGAALDVRTLEPPGRSDPLAGLEQVILTPHVAGLTREAQARVGRTVVADVLRVLAGRRPRHPA